MKSSSGTKSSLLSPPRISDRAQAIEPFYAVAIFREAMAMAEQGNTMLMCVGEPDFPTPRRVVDAAVEAQRRGETHYTVPAGIAPLRAGIASLYRERYGVEVPMERIQVTVGASGALALAFGVLANPGDEILMADPGYPSNRAMLTYCGASARLVPVGEAERFQLTAALVEEHWTPATRGVMVASPANPTGTSIPDDELRAIYEVVRRRGGTLVVDEIYHGLTYDAHPQTAAALGDDVFVVNSFSKYYCMTGWRLGWMVVPEPYAAAVERMSQHLFISPPAPSQWAGLAALEPESTAIFEAQRMELGRRRDYIVPALASHGLNVACRPDGAFYVYVDCSNFTNDTWSFVQQLLRATGVAVTPGRDFGQHRANEFLRISYTLPLPKLQEAVECIGEFVRRWPR
ncbi:MAG: aminotransferase class I/II-fold pyridoxal phosphate-dependent enzyme [Gemmatimonadaceae bacterium]